MPYVGTGILVSPNVVLTCAHNVYYGEKKKEHKEVRFYLKQHGLIKEYFEVEKHYYPEQFREGDNHAGVIFDFALLKLKNRVSGMKKFVPLCTDYHDLELDDKSCLEIHGYPVNCMVEENGSQAIYQHGLKAAGRLVEIREEKKAVYHKISSLGGQSGAPIL
jgi:V8-like Glu-specific endopeptidase